MGTASSNGTKETNGAFSKTGFRLETAGNRDNFTFLMTVKVVYQTLERAEVGRYMYRLV